GKKAAGKEVEETLKEAKRPVFCIKKKISRRRATIKTEENRSPFFNSPVEERLLSFSENT
ncbi:MAG: hypothetical protein US46_C0005G0001, partial [Candidatus Shapirobacteria bacterium GW2011_GWF2_37_20]